MPVPSRYLAEFNENGIYHVYNRTSNRQPLFNNDENRIYFLKQYAKYLQPVSDTFCWNLQPNHFHFLIRVKRLKEITRALLFKASQSVDDIASCKEGIQPSEGWIPSLHEGLKTAGLSKTEQKFLDGKITVDQLIVYYFKSFFQSYSLSFNKENNKTGNLFYKPFKRVEINKQSHFTQAIVYIHANAQKHRLCTRFATYKWSSWHTILSSGATHLCRQEVLDWFGGLLPLIEIHLERGVTIITMMISESKMIDNNRFIEMTSF